ncbi:MAG TPA: tetratricopeptide repeat protein [Candidatus Eisenbacteria bacterium]|nr:tetratricopeptide repeat protein [Candidatus Eisenbacteria bacterium]
MSFGGRRALLPAGLLLALALSACAIGCSTKAESTVPTDREGRAQLLIESGNRAYSNGNYGLAARRYAAAAVVREDDPAAYYGLGMALSKLGRDEEARSAYARARELSRR